MEVCITWLLARSQGCWAKPPPRQEASQLSIWNENSRGEGVKLFEIWKFWGKKYGLRPTTFQPVASEGRNAQTFSYPPSRLKPMVFIQHYCNRRLLRLEMAPDRIPTPSSDPFGPSRRRTDTAIRHRPQTAGYPFGGTIPLWSDAPPRVMVNFEGFGGFGEIARETSLQNKAGKKEES